MGVSGGSAAADAAPSPETRADSRRKSTATPEIAINVSAITMKASGPSISVRVPPRTGPTMRPLPKMIE